MLYHDADKCRENGGEEVREFGFPLVAVQLWSYGDLEMQCPACGRVWVLDAESRDVPSDCYEN